MPLTENERNTYHVLKKYSSNNTDTFFFNIKRAHFVTEENYKILEGIKDGVAISGKYDGGFIRFKAKNIVIVFSNTYPNRSQLSKDRWRIFEISKDLKDIVEESTKCKKKQEEMSEKLNE